MPSQSIKDKLAQLGAKLGNTPATPRVQPVASSGRPPLESLLPGGHWQEHAGGRVFVLESRYAPGHLLAPGHPLLPVEHTAQANACLRASAPPHGWLYLDTETTGLAGGTGTHAFLVGVGRFEQGGFVLRQFLMDDPAREPALLAALQAEFAGMTGTVTYNGKSFDLPLLTTRFVLNGQPPPHAALSHLDLLHIVRRLWRERLETCSLSCVEYHIMGLMREAGDIPGYQIPQLYFDWLRTGDGEFFEGVCYHNEVDILSLAALHRLLAALLSDPDAHGELAPALPLARLFEQAGLIAQAEAQYRRALPDDLARRGLAALCKRQNRREEAVALWSELPGDPDALVELAMHAEHHAKDIALALEHTRRALALVVASMVPGRAKALDDLEHRRDRLLRKLQAEQ